MVTKADLVAHLASKLEGVNKKQSREAVDAIFQAVTTELAKGEKVRLSGFGTFKVVEYAERQGRNPQTGKTIQIPARTGVRFQPSTRLRATLPGNPIIPPPTPKRTGRKTTPRKRYKP